MKSQNSATKFGSRFAHRRPGKKLGSYVWISWINNNSHQISQRIMLIANLCYKHCSVYFHHRLQQILSYYFLTYHHVADIHESIENPIFYFMKRTNFHQAHLQSGISWASLAEKPSSTSLCVFLRFSSFLIFQTFNLCFQIDIMRIALSIAGCLTRLIIRPLLSSENKYVLSKPENGKLRSFTRDYFLYLPTLRLSP